MSTEAKHIELSTIEEGSDKQPAALVQNPTYAYYQTHEKLHGFLSQQFPTIANPAPLGLCAFALTTFVFSMYFSGAIIDIHANKGVVLGLALFYGGLVQLLAGMWEFKIGNTLGALLFSSYGGFFLSYAALFINAFGFLGGYAKTPGDLDDALGIYFLAWTFYSGLMTVAAHRTNLVLVCLLSLVTLALLLLCIGKFKDNNLNLQRAGGAIGIIASALAWYGAMASLLTKKNSLFTLPVGDLDPIYRRMGWLYGKDPQTKQ